ncbi:toxin secretion/phage lysis holin [Acetoanaerobium noterae]|uniref:Toxin secretion/phage lysis holin n=1 Tax=Acetoanaerobium noterae TaxID=745369 RepID=A0A1T5ANE6_9FIRM|nr:phage holin family protein [Acetoanaerobium noterae]SKB36350.1 toxin secretion/phage lysis holin [Acetoanaerobium noterae]
MGESAAVKLITTFFGTCIVYAFGGVDLILRVLLFFLVLDYTTGLMKAFIRKDLSSAVGWNGLMKKIGTLIAVIVAHQMDKIDPTGSQLFRNAVVTFFIANEGVSLVENLAIIGVPVPSILKRALKAWKEETEVN